MAINEGFSFLTQDQLIKYLNKIQLMLKMLHNKFCVFYIECEGKATQLEARQRGDCMPLSHPPLSPNCL